MPDYGLIQAVGDSFQTGVSTYMKMKKQTDDAAAKTAENENKKIYYDYLKSKAQGKQGKGGKMDAMIKLAQSGLVGEWDEQGNLLAVRDDPALPHKGKGAKDYKGEEGLIHAKGDEAVRLQGERNKRPSNGKNYDREAELLGIKGKTAEEVARIRAEASKYGKDLPENRDSRLDKQLGSRERVAGLQNETRGLIADKNNQTRENVAGLNADSRGLIADKNNLTRENIAGQQIEGRGLVAENNNRTKERVAETQMETRGGIAAGQNVSREKIAGVRAETDRYKADTRPQPYGGEKDWRDKKNLLEAGKAGLIWDENEQRWKQDPNFKPRFRPLAPKGPGKAPGAAKPRPESAGEKKAGQDYAKQVVEWNTGGRQTMAEAVTRLEDAANVLRNEKGVTGTAVDRILPGGFAGAFTPRTKAVKDSVDYANNASLKATLGAQFTQKEGEGIRGQNFDRKLGQEENLKRVERQLAHLRRRIALGDALAQFLPSNRYSDVGFEFQKYTQDTAPSAFPQGKTAPAGPPQGGGKPRIERSKKDPNKFKYTYPDGRVEIKNGP